MLKEKTFDLAQFTINKNTFFIARHTKTVESLNLIDEYHLSTHFPKIYWSFRDSSNTKCALGSLFTTHSAPQIELDKVILGEKFSPSFYGGKSFMGQKPEKPFNNFEKILFFLPKIEIIQNGTQFTINYYQLTQSDAIEARFSILDKSTIKKRASNKVTKRSDAPSLDQWKENIEQVLSQMQQNHLQKVVLARCSSFEFEKNIDVSHLIKYLSSTQKNCSIFSFSPKANCTFLGATPECLYKRDGLELSTEAVAGTALSCDKIDLLNSLKELNEFNFVSDYLLQKLSPLSTKILKGKNTLVDTGSVKHLYSLFKVTLHPQIDDLEIINTLHPTPALCGTPKDKAFKLIKELEPFDRGLYAAPIGRVSIDSAEFIIAIRSCLVMHNKLKLFVGNGIVKDSCALMEWQELKNKIKPYLDYFDSL